MSKTEKKDLQDIKLHQEITETLIKIAGSKDCQVKIKAMEAIDDIIIFSKCDEQTKKRILSLFQNIATTQEKEVATVAIKILAHIGRSIADNWVAEEIAKKIKKMEKEDEGIKLRYKYDGGVL